MWLILKQKKAIVHPYKWMVMARVYQDRFIKNAIVRFILKQKKAVVSPYKWIVMTRVYQDRFIKQMPYCALSLSKKKGHSFTLQMNGNGKGLPGSVHTKNAIVRLILKQKKAVVSPYKWLVMARVYQDRFIKKCHSVLYAWAKKGRSFTFTNE